jgi:hypothetical protein
MRIGPPSISFMLSTRVPRVTMTRCSRTSCFRTLRIRGIKGRQALSSVIDRAISEGQTDTALSRNSSDRSTSDLRAASVTGLESLVRVICRAELNRRFDVPERRDARYHAYWL